MDHAYIIDELARNREVFRVLLEGKSAEEANWRPAPDKWSLLEIVCHLRDEEVEDFRTRTDHVFKTPDVSPPPIDPPAWVSERNYAGQDYDAVVAQFLAERDQSIAWLKSLKSPPWKNTYQHSHFGPMSAEYFLANWLAHDKLHLRQLNATSFKYLQEKSGEALNYAGDW